jgi:hypothetical protein
VSAPKRATKFVVLVYRMPAKPTAGRVAVWRLLKKAGAVYLQDSVCVFPDLPRIRRELQPVLERIDEKQGSYHLLPLRAALSADEEEKIVELFREQTSKHYLEIVEDCEVNFTKEIEFEHFRANYTYEEAEEIRMEFEKLGTWFERVKERDWFDAPHRPDAERWLEKCERLLEDFEAKVFEVLGTSEGQAPTLRVVASSESR